MRDLALAILIFGSIPFILWRPVIGVFLWVWVSVMSPHRLTWDFAYDFRFAQLIAIATIIGLIFSKEPKRMPVTATTVVLFLLVVWMNVTTLFALNTAPQTLAMWERVMKIQVMIFVALYLLHSRRHIEILIWILAGSLAFFAIKGGLFTLRVGGEYRVYGPAGSFIEDNNSLALAVTMTIPLLRYLHMCASSKLVRWGLVASMLVCGFSVLGSHSRGAFLAVAAMLGFLWLKTRGKIFTALIVLVAVPVSIAFMPEKWSDRMKSIQSYSEDSSALGRINAWTMAFNLAKDRPLVGGGFEPINEEIFARYAPNPSAILSAHSIYFQILGEHGFVGLALFLLLWYLAWRDAAWIIRQSRKRLELRWASDLARMIQVSLVGYAVGGAFLNLAYYDVPYNLLVVLVLTRLLVARAMVQQKSPGALGEPQGGPPLAARRPA